MINAILSGILNFLSGLITLVFKPIDQYIDTNIPSLSTVLNSIGATFQFISNGLGWVIDSFCLPQFSILFLIATFTFRFNIRLFVHGVKIAVKWWDKLIP